MENNYGVLLTATGKKYIDSAIRAAKTVRKHSPTLKVHLNADWKNYPGYHFDQDPTPFTSVDSIENPHRRSKLEYLRKTPFDRTLFLDTDTAFASDITPMFELLDRFDIAAAHAHRRNYPLRLKPWRIELPQVFPQFNTGVLLYQSTPEVLEFMDNWWVAFQEAGFPQDQITFRELIWQSDLRIATLPPEYNVRYLKYLLIWKKREAAPKIFHLQLFHEGPFWWIKGPVKNRVRNLLIKIGVNPKELKRKLLDAIKR